ncbi:MAG TPA: hypothetical protein ENK18_16560 [Deltaproteobacteria bacterium]|nr:hypothetical protein [Deltaproteobacteria bacterium]
MSRTSPALAALLIGCSNNVLEVSSENNYSYSGQLAIQQVEVAALTDGTIDWSAITTDIRGRAFDGSVDQVLFVEFDLPQAEILEKIDANALQQQDAGRQFLIEPDTTRTSVLLSELEIVGNFLVPETDLDAVDPGQRNWLVSVVDTPNGSIDALMSKFVVPSGAATNTDIALVDGCSTLDVTVDLSSAPSLIAPAGKPDVLMDWSGLTTDVHGNPWDSLLADQLLVARFDVASPADIEEIFLRLDSEAAELYRGNVFGVTEAELATAVDDSGNTFPGFSDQGVWLVGIGCSTCFNPVPMVIFTVEVR